MAETQPNKEQSRGPRQIIPWEKRGHSTRLRNKEKGIEASMWQKVRLSRAPQPDFLQIPRNVGGVSLSTSFYCGCPGLAGCISVKKGQLIQGSPEALLKHHGGEDGDFPCCSSLCKRALQDGLIMTVTSQQALVMPETKLSQLNMLPFDFQGTIKDR